MLSLLACHIHFEKLPAVTECWKGVQDEKQVDPGQAGGLFQEAAVQ